MTCPTCHQTFGAAHACTGTGETRRALMAREALAGLLPSRFTAA